VKERCENFTKQDNKMKLSLEKLLELLPGFRVDHRGRNLTGPCPMCGQDEFGISLEEGHKFGCYRKAKCGFNGNILVLLRHLGKLDEIQQEKSTVLPNKIEKKQQFEDHEDLTIENIKPPIGWKRIYSHPYLDERGFTKEDYLRYPVGITSLAPKLKDFYIIFLTEQQQQIKGWVGRRIQSKEEIEKLNLELKAKGLKPVVRYRNSFSDFAKMCYGIDEVNDKVKTIIIVEGIFDKINVDKLLKLYDCEDTKCINTYKAALSPEQIGLISKVGPNIELAILLYDPDVIKSIKESMAILQRYYQVLVGFHKEKDPGEMNEEDINLVLDTLQTPIEFKSCKLEVKKL